MEIVAVDWSGRATGAEQFIWLARVIEGELVELRNGIGRDQIAAHLLDGAASARPDDLVIGLDFAFSFPWWFCHELDATCIEEVWAEAAACGERWLSAGESPFWGRERGPRPELIEHFRRTELAVGSVAGVRPKSIFQIGGAGAVGTGSIRGMPVLTELAKGGLSVWPFGSDGSPRVVEIYPRVLTGAVRKSDRDARAAYVADFNWKGSSALRELAVSSEDAFDAAISALAMWGRAGELARLEATTDAVERLEGRIWLPRGFERSNASD